MRTRAFDLEMFAWALVVHDHAACLREGSPQCVELQRLIEYFEEHGVPAPAIDRMGNEFIAHSPASHLGVTVKP